MEFVCCTEVVRLSESPLLEFSLYLCMIPIIMQFGEMKYLWLIKLDISYH